MNKLQKHKQRLGLLLLITAIILWNIFGMRFGFDLIVLTLAVFGLIKGEGNKFVRDWLPPVLLFMLYEFLRGHAFSLSNEIFGTTPIVQLLIDIERKVFPVLSDVPTVLLQNYLRPDLSTYSWYDPVLFFFYSSFFWYWLAVGYALWAKKRELFKPFMYGLIGFSLAGVIIYFFLPTAPPWYASEIGALPYTERILWKNAYLPSNSLSLISAYGRNDFAALPSHHAAWPFFSSLFLIHAFGKKMWITLLIPAVIMFATWYGSEHYVIDSVAGMIMAGGTFILVTKYRNKLVQIWQAFLHKF